MAAYKSCSGVNFFLTAQNGVFTFSDNSGYNQPISGTFTQIVTGVTNTAIRGIAFAPGTTPPGPIVASIGLTVNPTCHGSSNGAILLNVSGGGTSSYSYAWSDGSVTTQNRNNLAAGIYKVTVTGAGCSATAADTLVQPAGLTLDSTVTNVSCNGGSNGSIVLNPGGGASPYTWAPSNLSALSAGTYDITVSDANSCSTTAAITIGQPSAISITDTLTNLACSGGGNTGAVSIGVSGEPRAIPICGAIT